MDETTTVFINRGPRNSWRALEVNAIMLPNGLIYDSEFHFNPKHNIRNMPVSMTKSKVFRANHSVEEYEALYDALRKGKVGQFTGYDPSQMKDWIERWLKDGSKTG